MMISIISHQKEVDEAHSAKLKNFKNIDGVPEVECPNCGMQFEDGE